MNALKLKELLNEFSDESLENLEVSIQTFGTMGGNNVRLETAYVGFDWERGQLVLTPQKPMTVFSKK